jgi:hypothetical protein
MFLRLFLCLCAVGLLMAFPLDPADLLRTAAPAPRSVPAPPEVEFGVNSPPRVGGSRRPPGQEPDEKSLEVQLATLLAKAAWKSGLMPPGPPLEVTPPSPDGVVVSRNDRVDIPSDLIAGLAAQVQERSEGFYVENGVPAPLARFMASFNAQLTMELLTADEIGQTVPLSGCEIEGGRKRCMVPD